MLRLAPKLLALMLALLLALTAFGQTIDSTANLYRIPSGRVQLSGGAVTINGDLSDDTFVLGLGWLSGSASAAPLRAGDALYLDADNLARLGLEGEPVAELPLAPESDPWRVPRAAEVRFGGDSQVRIVVDLPHLSSAAPLRHMEGQGKLEEDGILALMLPDTLAPQAQPEPYHGIDVTLLETPLGVSFELRGPALSYEVFTLEAPTRLVVDVVPLRDRHYATTFEVLTEGVVYRTFGAATPVGQSLVHLLEIDPGAGEFRVVGTSEVARTLSELANGAFAAINGGYFNTSNFQTIGLLRVDYGLQSLPSRNRASIGFGYAGAVMNRVTATVNVRVGGRIYRREAPTTGAGVQVHTVPGALAGSPSKGALVAEHGRIVANRVGPVRVPPSGFVVVYPPDDRDLALIDPGAGVGIEVDFEPDAFQAVRYAVEAGPLLVENGVSAFKPHLEEFSRGERILDAYTQQSAIGIRPDGTVLFLVAENMRAIDLVPLFLDLGAADAMRLDSGSSATLLAGGKVLNRAHQRHIVSAIVFLPGPGDDTMGARQSR